VKIKKRSQFPECIRHFKELKGICIGECIDNIQFGKSEAAHAHCYDGDPYQGWICLKHKYQLKSKLILLHEVAHLIANRHIESVPHGKGWKKVLLSIGGTFKSFIYNRRGRKARETIDYTYRSRKI